MAVGAKIATYFEGAWQMGNTPIIRAADHVAWLGSQVFDGARRFEGVMPDLDLHCERIIRSAEAMGMVPPVTAQDIIKLVHEGATLFDPQEDLYIRPMMWSCDSDAGIIDFIEDSTSFAICIEALPMAAPKGFSLTVAPYCRPRQDMALTEAKAGSLYPNNSRIMRYARSRGFSNALSLDINGHVAETASTNVFLVKGGIVYTPRPNGCFLNGITRQRVIKLLRAHGIKVQEDFLNIAEFEQADEIFVTGNIAKVMPVERFKDTHLGTGEMSLLARRLYWEFSHAS